MAPPNRWISYYNRYKQKPDLISLFASLGILNLINSRYNIQFKEILSDNGSEFGSGPKAGNKDSHPFEQMLAHLGIKHRYTRPYRPRNEW